MCDISAKDILLAVNSLAILLLAGFMNSKLARLKTDLGVGLHVKKRRYERMEKAADPLLHRMTGAYIGVSEFLSGAKAHLSGTEIKNLDARERGSDGALQEFENFMGRNGFTFLGGLSRQRGTFFMPLKVYTSVPPMLSAIMTGNSLRTPRRRLSHLSENS